MKKEVPGCNTTPATADADERVVASVNVVTERKPAAGEKFSGALKGHFWGALRGISGGVPPTPPPAPPQFLRSRNPNPDTGSHVWSFWLILVALSPGTAP